MATLYLTEQHSYVHKDAETLIVRKADKTKVTIPLMKVDQVVVMGDVTLSAGALGALLEAGTEVCFCTQWGKFRGRLSGDWTKNSLVRLAQHRAHNDAERTLLIARRFVWGKLCNMRTVLLRGNRKRDSEKIAIACGRLKNAAETALGARSVEELLGIEGSGSAAYFGVFGELLSAPFEFHGRVRRPPRDPVNALLSLGYTILTNNVCSAVSLVGMDPYVGFLHSSQYGKPALALDITEEFRPLVVDSTVLTVINNHMLDLDDFDDELDSVWLRDAARKRYLTALEERFNTEIEHPVFGYRTTYRRCIELQTRLTAKWLTGEVPEYPPFRVR